jgi:hypothetical protein
MRPRFAILTIAALIATILPVIHFVNAEIFTDTLVSQANNVSPQNCGLTITINSGIFRNIDDDQLMTDNDYEIWDVNHDPSAREDDLVELTITATSGPTGGVLKFEILAGGNKINNTLWLDSNKKNKENTENLVWTLEANSTLTKKYYVEGYECSDVIGDVKFRAYIDCPAGVVNGVNYGMVQKDIVKETTVYELDLDIDSNNDNGYENTGYDDKEDQIELSPKNGKTGKIITTSIESDFDNDGLLDFADLEISGQKFVPVRLELKVPYDPANTKILIAYTQSKPEISSDGYARNGDGSAQNPFKYELLKGGLRLWKNDAPLRKQSDFVASDFISWSDLAPKLDDGSVSRVVTLYLEYVNKVIPEAIGRTSIVVNTTAGGIGVTGRDQIFVTLLPCDVAVDANRDGIITFDAQDRTSKTKPYRFWVNNDRDIEHTVDTLVHFPGQQEEDDVNSNEQSNEDWKEPGINYKRDLEDFTRIWIDFRGISEVFNLSDEAIELKVRMKYVSGAAPKINLFDAVEIEGGRDYLKDVEVADSQILDDFNKEIAKADALDAGDTSQTINRQAWTTLSSKKSVCFLFEGAQNGDGYVFFEFWKNGSKLFDFSPVFVRLRKADDFYETWTVGDLTEPNVNEETNKIWPKSIAEPQPNTGRDLVEPTTDAEKDYIMFVHGWNMSQADKTQFADTMYKRLWHLGYKGRFGAYRWPTFYTGSVEYENFNGSEERAWNSAAPLAALIQNRAETFSIEGKSMVRLFGHSMGNIVSSEALRVYGNVDNAPVHTYISGQSALAAHCWDKIKPRWMNFTYVLPVPPFTQHTHYSGTANIYRGYWQAAAGSDAPHKWEDDGRPSYMAKEYMPKNVNYINHYNKEDWALASWELNQKLKPTVSYHYGWVPGSAIGSEERFYKNLINPTVLLCPQDRFQIFSWASEARSFATGAEPATNELFSRGVDLHNDYGFDGDHKGHSAQFRSTIQRRWNYWSRFLDDNRIQY